MLDFDFIWELKNIELTARLVLSQDYHFLGERLRSWSRDEVQLIEVTCYHRPMTTATAQAFANIAFIKCALAKLG